MRWDRSYTSSNIEDRRAEGGVGLGGGFGGGGGGLFGLLRIFSLFGWKGILVGILIVGALAVKGMFGGLAPSSNSHVANAPVQSSAAEDELVHFVGFVFDDVQNYWHRESSGYKDARMVLFRNAVRSACGTASTAVGPFYCPGDRKVYIDLSFYDELRKRFEAPGDFAQAYVIAHEVGHHVQNQRGLFGDKENSVKIELQADCLAGAWGKDANARNILEVGDLEEALNAATAIGDDTLQRKATGHVQPDTFTHGTSAQRVAAFKQGFEGGPSACGL
jgi:predicted metalloprotease